MRLQCNVWVILLIYVQEFNYSHRQHIIKCNLIMLDICNHLFCEKQLSILYDKQWSHQSSRICVDHDLAKFLVLSSYNWNVHKFLHQSFPSQSTNLLYNIFIENVPQDCTVQYYSMATALSQVAFNDSQIAPFKFSAWSCYASGNGQVFNQSTTLTIGRIAWTNHSPMASQ